MNQTQPAPLSTILRKRIVELFLLAAMIFSSATATAEKLLATTKQGDLIEIDLDTGTATFRGSAAKKGWSDLSFDSEGTLFTVSRVNAETDNSAHLYRLNANTGAVEKEIGSTGEANISDIEFAPDGTLYGSKYQFVDENLEQGILVTINPTTAEVTEIGPFGDFEGQPIFHGGLSVHPDLDPDGKIQIWGVESGYRPARGLLFKLDPFTFKAISTVRMSLNGEPFNDSFGFDGFEILPSGRFIATIGRGLNEIYEIDPTPNDLGFAEVTFLLSLHSGMFNPPLDQGQTISAANGIESLGVSSDEDEDGDGVPNDQDSCPGTEAGAPVDASGCSIPQTCPCDGFKNHGQFVACVARTAEDFVQLELITETEASEIISEAAASSCSKKSKKSKISKKSDKSKKSKKSEKSDKSKKSKKSKKSDKSKKDKDDKKG